MNNISIAEQTAFQRISTIVKNLMANNSIYQERLNQEQMIKYICDLFNKPNAGSSIEIIEQEELINRINGILVLHSVAETLNDFTPEEMAIFDEAVKRK